MRIAGHSSFVSRAIFQKLNEQYFRVISVGFDGKLSFKEFNRTEFRNSEEIESAETTS